MVQIIEADRPFQRFAEGAGNLGDALGKYLRGKREDAALEKQGYKVTGITDPKTRQLLLEGQIKSKQSATDLEKDALRTDTISKYFGPNVGQLYSQLTDGGKTKLSDVALTAISNNMSFEDALMQHVQKNPEDIQDFIPQKNQSQLDQSPQEQIASQQQQAQAQQPMAQQKLQMKPVEKKEEFAFPEVPLPPMPPKDIRGYKTEIRKSNAPIFQENNEKLKSLKTEATSLKTLDSLNKGGKLPKKLGRVFIDKEGHIKPWAQILSLVPPEAERFVKTINQFTKNAKDYYGSRVTNFDLAQFMKQLPTLMNSEEGRDMIIKDMEVSNREMSLYNNALKKVYQHYGLDGITEEQADEIAEQMIAPEVEKINEQREILNKDSRLMVAKSKTPAGRVMVEIDGKIGHVPEQQVELILKRGGRRL